jgi:nucleoside 2-deoxyribosyltransferase
MSAEAQTPIQLIHAVVDSVGACLLSAHIAERFGEDTHAYTPAQVTTRDFQWMVASSLFVAILPCDSAGNLIKTDGTHVELGWASALGRPIIVLAPRQAQHQLSHLVKGLGTVATVSLLCLEEVMRDDRELRTLLVKHVQKHESIHEASTLSAA